MPTGLHRIRHVVGHRIRSLNPRTWGHLRDPRSVIKLLNPQQVWTSQRSSRSRSCSCPFSCLPQRERVYIARAGVVWEREGEWIGRGEVGGGGGEGTFLIETSGKFWGLKPRKEFWGGRKNQCQRFLTVGRYSNVEGKEFNGTCSFHFCTWNGRPFWFFSSS